MWFKNKNTGLKWEVVDTEIIKRLSKDDNYEEVKDKVIKEIKEEKVEVKKETKKSTTKKK